MSTAASFITAKKWKQAKCPSADEWINTMWINTMWYVHTTRYYLAIKRYKAAVGATICITWRTLCSVREEHLPYCLPV